LNKTKKISPQRYNNVMRFLLFQLLIYLILSLNPNIRFNGIGSIGSFYYAQLTGYCFVQGGINLGVAYKF